jgi:hypothetical protein
MYRSSDSNKNEEILREENPSYYSDSNKYVDTCMEFSAHDVSLVHPFIDEWEYFLQC